MPSLDRIIWEVALPETNHQLRRARESVASSAVPGERLSRHELAEQLNRWVHETAGETVSLDAHYIAKLERGAIRWPRAIYRDALRAVLGASSDLDLGLRPHRARRDDGARPHQAPPSSLPATTQSTDRVEASGGVGAGDALALVGANFMPGFGGRERATERRQLLAVTGATLAAAVAESVALGLRQEATDVGPVTVEQLDLAVEQFGLVYLHVPPAALFPAVRDCRTWVTNLLENRLTLTQRSRLCAAAGWLSGLLGQLSLDLGSDAAATAHCLTAAQLAAETGNGELAAWVRSTQAMIAVYSDRPDEAVTISRAGHDAAPKRSITRVRLAAQEARGQARRGDATGVRDAFARADRALDSVRVTPNHSIFSFDAPYLPFYAGTCYLWLGEPATAQRHARKAISLCDAAPHNWPVARALARVDLATALAQTGEIDSACQIAGEALTIYERERPIDLIARRLVEVTDATRPHQRLPAVADFNERRRTVTATAAHAF